MLIDTHAHVNFKFFKEDGDEVIRRSLNENTWLIIVGANYKTSKRALDYANRYEKGVYASIGLHPVHLFDYQEEESGRIKTIAAEDFNNEVYEKLASFPKVVAIGEIGLDYYHLSQRNAKEIKNKQKEVFINQLLLARKMNLPAIIHCRQAHDDLLALIRDFKKERKELFGGLPAGAEDRKPWGVMHCFSGNEDLAWQYFSLGLIVSFTGVITFSKQWDGLIRKLPNDKFMLETDCPFMTPEPYRGKRNEPVLVKQVAERIAEIKNLSLERVGEITSLNAKNLFNIKD